MSATPGSTDAMSMETAGKLREIGARIEPAGTAAIYAPLQQLASSDHREIRRDLAYGSHDRNVLDVFGAVGSQDELGARADRPVIVFVHGGGFVRGAKQLEGLPFYDNVMHWAAAQGMVGVNINYRLAPDFQWPSGIEDLTAVVAWLQANISDYGGDSDKVFLWGHSAGAAHVGNYLADRARRRRPANVAGAILTSGFYQLGDEVSAWQAYYGDDVALYAERSSLAALAAADVPLLVNDAELDPENFRSQARLLVDARHEAGKPVRYLHLLGHSHISETYAVGTSDKALSGPVLDFVTDTVGAGGSAL